MTKYFAYYSQTENDTVICMLQSYRKPKRLNINLYNKTQEPLRKCEGHETAGGYFQSTPRSSSLGEMYVKEAGVFYLYNKTQEPCFYRVTREVAKDTRKA